MNTGSGRLAIYTWLVLLLLFCGGIVFVGIYNNFTLTKDQNQFWDLALKGVGGIVAVSGAAIAVIKYIDEQAKANRAALIEANKPFMTKRQEVYYELVSATAILSTEPEDDPEWIKSESIFWKLYWGALPLVIDDPVATATNEFENALLNDSLKGEQKYVAMRNASMKLAQACRISLGFK